MFLAREKQMSSKLFLKQPCIKSRVGLHGADTLLGITDPSLGVGETNHSRRIQQSKAEVVAEGKAGCILAPICVGLSLQMIGVRSLHDDMLNVPPGQGRA